MESKNVLIMKKGIKLASRGNVGKSVLVHLLASLPTLIVAEIAECYNPDRKTSITKVLILIHFKLNSCLPTLLKSHWTKMYFTSRRLFSH